MEVVHLGLSTGKTKGHKQAAQTRSPHLAGTSASPVAHMYGCMGNSLQPTDRAEEGLTDSGSQMNIFVCVCRLNWMEVA